MIIDLDRLSPRARDAVQRYRESWQARRGPLDGLDPRGATRRVADSMWSPQDPRLFQPRAVGLGWDLNLGAVAVRLGLIEPDAEDVPFEAAPDSAFEAAAALPIACAVATVAHYAVRGRTLPPRLPAHWSAGGTPDRLVSKRRAGATDIAVTVASAGLASWAGWGRGSGPERAGSLAAASAIGALGLATTGLRSLPPTRRPWAGPVMVAAPIAAAGVVLLGLARAGRAAEIRRDLPGAR